MDLLGFRNLFLDAVYFEVAMLGKYLLGGSRAGADPLTHEALVVYQGKAMGVGVNHDRCPSHREPQVQRIEGSR